MGLAEQKLAGATLTRKSTTFTTAAVGSGSVEFGASYAILSIESSTPCRIRFYENTGSRDDVGEINRIFGDTNISSSIALVGDFSMSLSGKYTTDPVLYGVTHDAATTYYRIEPSTPTTITITTYTIEDNSVLPTVGTQYTLNNRRTLPELNALLTSSGYVSGTLDGVEIPRTFLLVSASVVGSGNIGRLRFYSNSNALTNPSEVSRSFSVEPSASARLIADMILSGSEITYFTPKIIGANLKTVGTSLQPLVGNRTVIDSDNEIYYILQNAGSTTSEISASVHIFSIED